ncbi:MAG: hypothetical protein E7493_01455 [Ruminococcus albus]|nr:hypothetical protein [Ruminococcus albus]
MTKKKKTAAAVSVGVLMLAAIGAVLAYFGAKDKKPNLVGVGEDKINVSEVFTPPDQTNDFFYRKLVQIDNTGSVPCYVRVRLEMSDSDIQSKASFSADMREEAPNVSDDGYDDFLATFRKAEVGEDTEDTKYYINDLPEGWVYVREDSPTEPSVTAGYYYYTKPVEAGESTKELLSWVHMDYSGTEPAAHDVYVYAESVQTVRASDGTDYTADEQDGWKSAWHDFAG